MKRKLMACLTLSVLFAGMTHAANYNFRTIEYRIPEAGYGVLQLPHGKEQTALPLVVLANGNGYQKGDYTYLSSNLLNSGFAVINVEAPDESGIFERSSLIVSHLKRLLEGGNPVQFASIALIGHSRGGEAVVHAANQLSEIGIACQAVVSLAPTQLEPLTVPTSPSTNHFLVLYGSHDTDVYGELGLAQPMTSPFGLYDEAFAMADRAKYKAFFYVDGGSHSGFSDAEDVDNHPDGGDVGFLSTSSQRTFTAGVIQVFLKWALNKDHVSGRTFKESYLNHGGLLQNSREKVNYKALYSGDVIYPIQNFETPSHLSEELKSGRITTSRNLHLKKDYHYCLDPFSVHRGKGLLVSWQAHAAQKMKPYLQIGLEQDLSHTEQLTHLAINVGQKYRDELNGYGDSQDFHIRLVGDRRSHKVRASDWGPIKYPVENIERESPNRDFTKSALSTLVIPIDAFQGAKGPIYALEFIFDVPRLDGSLSGTLIFDDIKFLRL